MSDWSGSKPEFMVTDEAALRALFRPVHDRAIRKCLDRLGGHARNILA